MEVVKTDDKSLANLAANLTGQVQLQTTGEQFRLMVEQVRHEAISLLDPQGHVLSWNAGAKRIKGYRAEEIIGQHFSVFFTREDRNSRIPQQVLDLAHSRGSTGQEGWRLRKDGSRFWASVTVTALFDAAGGLAGFGAVTRDATGPEVGSLQQSTVLEPLFDNPHPCEIRMLELQAVLKNQVAHLAANSRELEAFSSSVSHDLLAPLRHIIGFVDLFKTRDVTGLDEKGQYYLQSITHASRRMGSLIDDMLSFSRMGQAEVMKTRIDFGQLVRAIVKDAAEEVKDREIEWVIATLPEVVGDLAMLRQVVVNLVSNAVKFSKPRPRARVEVGTLDEHPSETLFFVRDNGVGFDMRYVHQLFGPFRRLHNPEDFDGNGVGLAHVQRIIVRHGGRVWAEGAVDGGATFWFSLPKAEHP